MRVNTRVVTDIESGRVLDRDSYEYVGPVALLNPGKSPYQAPAAAVSTQQNAAGIANEGAAQGTLSQFEGPVQQSPFYKALLTSGLESTSNAYQNVQSRARENAQKAGLGGGNQPAAQTNATAVDSQEAGALARVPGQAMLEATGPALEAAGQTGRMGQQQVGEGMGALRTANDIYGQDQQRKQALWKTLAGVGMDAATMGLTAGSVGGFGG